MEEEKMFKVKLLFNEEQMEVSINSQYEYFFNTICNIFRISLDQLENIIVSYKDSDEDDVILSNREDYNIFFEQVSQNQVDNFKISLKEDSDLDQDKLLINLLNYQDEHGLENNINRNNIDNNYDEIEERNHNYEENNDEVNINYDMDNQNKVNKDIPIDDIIFDYKCNSCGLYPIVCKLFYCSKCSFYLCEECKQKGVQHEHELLSIESREVLRNIKEEENEEIEKKQEEAKKLMEREKFQQNQPNQRIKNDFNNYHYPNNPQIHPGVHLGFRYRGNRRFYYINNNYPINPNVHHCPNIPYHQNIPYNSNINNNLNFDYNNLNFDYNCPNYPNFQQINNNYDEYQRYYNKYY